MSNTEPLPTNSKLSVSIELEICDSKYVVMLRGEQNEVLEIHSYPFINIDTLPQDWLRAYDLARKNAVRVLNRAMARERRAAVHLWKRRTQQLKELQANFLPD